MSEYLFVEKPFLDQLHDLGWEVIDQGAGLPIDPAKSLRSDFREVVLSDVFKENVRRINQLSDGREWLTDAQLESLLQELTTHPAKSLIDANREVLSLLYRSTVDSNELTGEEFPDVQIIDFQHPERNHFVAINQFRIDTPGRGKGHIRPDIVLFVNGLPLVVIECKESNEYTSNPIFEAVKQLRRYSNQREETHEAGLREGEERLFHFNQLVIATCEDDARFGTISSPYEYFFNWKAIYPEKFKKYTPPLGKERSQELLIQGMLAPETLLDIVRHYMLYMTVNKTLVKITCRYQQYRAVTKMVERLRGGKTPEERSGVVWHTQGSGKSLTMVFLVRKLRTADDLKDYKVLMVNDRIDLEDQLSETATLTGERVYFVNSSVQLKKDLANDTSNLNMVMVHKFREEKDRFTPELVKDALAKYGVKPISKGGLFGVVSDSERILMLVDEAHRTQSGDLGDNLFEGFPNATRIAFTGTPLIAERHAKRTVDRFGKYIDKYKLQDAVEDGTTLQILYEGKTAETALSEKHKFDTKFEDLFKERTDDEIIAIKKKYGATDDILDAEKRIEAIANDMVAHYVENVLPNRFKAQVVCNSKIAAVRYKTSIDKALLSALEKEQAKEKPDEELTRQIAFLKSEVVLSADQTNELAVITHARKHSLEVNAIDNFKKPFDYDEPETGIAFLVVCDMLLTGFDAPIEQVMYIDKRVKEHTLLQTIARVNRVQPGKMRGYIVDYIGLAHHLKEALSIYAEEDQNEVQSFMKSIATELPVLESRYRRLIQLFKDGGVREIEEFVEQRIKETSKEYSVLEGAIELLKNPKRRADFEIFLKKFLQSMDIILPHPTASPFKIPLKRFGYIFAQVRERYKDDTLNIAGAGEKVRRLINEHLISLGINPKIPPVELVSPKFIKQLAGHKSPRAKASEMEHAIRKHCKVHLEEDPALFKKMSEKLEALIKKHGENWDLLAKELDALREEVVAGRKDEVVGLTVHESPFYDLINMLAFENGGPPQTNEEKLKRLTKLMVDKIRGTIGIINFWSNGFEVGKLKGDLSDLVLLTDIDELVNKSDRIVTEVTALAKVRHKDLI